MTAVSVEQVQALVQVTRAAPLFDRLAAAVAERVNPRAFVDDSSGGASGLSVDDTREQLDCLFPEFQELYGRLLVKYLGDENVARVLRALRDPFVQRYFQALKAMETELRTGLQVLEGNMVAIAARATSAHPPRWPLDGYRVPRPIDEAELPHRAALGMSRPRSLRHVEHDAQ